MAELKSSLKVRVLRAGWWSIFSFGSGQTIRLATNLIVARILAPSDFGVMAVASSAIIIISLFSDVGFKQSIIRSGRGEDLDMLHTAWTLQVIQGAIICSLCIFVAFVLYLILPNISLRTDSVYGHPDLPQIIAILGVSSLISGFNPSKGFIAHRHLNLKKILVIGLISQLFSVIIVITYAFTIGTVWAFVWGALSAASIQLILLRIILSGPSDRFLLDRGCIGELFSFGKWILFSSTVYVLTSNIDKVIFGYLISANSLGLYSVASSIAKVPDAVVGRLFSSVAFPALSEIYRADTKRVQSAYYKLRIPMDICLFSASGFIFAVSNSLITYIYDDRYYDAGWILQFLSVLLIFSRQNLDVNLYMTIGEPRYWTFINCIRLISILLLLPLGFYISGFEGAIIGIILASIPTMAAIYWINWGLGFIRWRYELLAIPLWPVGYTSGSILVWYF